MPSSPSPLRDREKSSKKDRDKKDRDKKDRDRDRDHKKHRDDSPKRKETPEEKARRKLEKKLKKEAKKKEKKEKKEKSIFGYTNDNNPFGDSNLTEAFVWKAKVDKMIKQGVDPEQISKKRQKERLKELQKEVEKVKKRRLEREEERRLWEEEKSRIARERDLEGLDDWETKEEEFERKQAQIRSKVRLKEGRARPIDILAKNLALLYPKKNEKPSHADDDEDMLTIGDFDLEMREPYKIFEGLSTSEIESLREDIKAYQDLESQSDFWDALMVVCEDELEKARRHDVRVAAGIHDAVRDDVSSIFIGKTYEELEKMQEQITDKINNDTSGGVDIEYWSSLLKELNVFKAKAKLREYHARLLQLYLDYLQQTQHSQGADIEAKRAAIVNALAGGTSEQAPSDTTTTTTGAGKLSPTLERDYDETKGGAKVLDPEKDALQLMESRQKVLDKAKASSSFADQFGGELGESEELFKDEFALPEQTYSWNDKYRPRKPKFFNRVHTGYEWNKYNQTHYDHDNPPPKVVKGYKFNIFYPDLIDKSKAPTYVVEPGPDDDTAILRFHAGPPYEDIAFKIVNKEWEFSHRRGFKCTFERGILHLYFNFKRYRYRR
eukprot:GEZU01005295.1.p1 GENE.GEZU01005295.1~~GEZU01005295.1.p1  ORF type:complete len:608 (+),score=213.77 GEZU01005295.1:57-1880(+)